MKFLEDTALLKKLAEGVKEHEQEEAAYPHYPGNERYKAMHQEKNEEACEATLEEHTEAAIRNWKKANKKEKSARGFVTLLRIVEKVYAGDIGIDEGRILHNFFMCYEPVKGLENE